MSKRNHSSPLKTMFLTTSMPVGGAEVLLADLVRGLDRNRVLPEICCLKEQGPLGEQLAEELPVHSGLLSSKYDLRVLPRLIRLFRRRRVDAVVTVGAGDKMFWGRLAARLAGVPVVASALHSTGWPDSIGRLNRLLTPLTDVFIGVADAHAEHLASAERFPRERVATIYNGVDTKRFSPGDGTPIRRELGIDTNAPAVGILAALRPEKNHELFLRGAAEISTKLHSCRFIIIGDGPCREPLESLTQELGIVDRVRFLGSRSDVPEILRALDVLALTSHNEASPVSILEALATGVPVVSSEVGSVPEVVVPGETGSLFQPGDQEAFVAATVSLLQDPDARRRMGEEGRRRVCQRWSLEAMVSGYEELLCGLHRTKTQPLRSHPISSLKRAKPVPGA